MSCCPASQIRNVGDCTKQRAVPDPFTCDDSCCDICAGMPVALVQKTDAATGAICEYVLGPDCFSTQVDDAGVAVYADYASAIAAFAAAFDGVSADEKRCDPCEKQDECHQVYGVDCSFNMDIELDQAYEYGTDAMFTLAEDPDNPGQISTSLYMVTTDPALALFQATSAVSSAGPTCGTPRMTASVTAVGA